MEFCNGSSEYISDENIRLYECALKHAKEQIEKTIVVYNQCNRVPFNGYVYNDRIKSDASIQKKIDKKKILCNKNEICDYINDIAGIRLVFNGVVDVVKAIEAFKNYKYLDISECEDYIMNPKESGYMSYHITVITPILLDGVKRIPVEIQLRTKTMNMCSELEYDHYKNGEFASSELKDKYNEMCKLALAERQLYMNINGYSNDEKEYVIGEENVTGVKIMGLKRF